MNEDSRRYFKEQAEKIRGYPNKARIENEKANKAFIILIAINIIQLIALGLIIYKLWV